MWWLETLLACLGFGVGAALQKHGVSKRLPRLSFATLRDDWRGVLRGFASNWTWWLGVLTSLTGGLFLILALAHGEISVVQPLVNLNILVAILAGVLFLGERLSPVEWAGALAMVGGAVLLSVGAGAAVVPPPGFEAPVLVLTAIGVLVVGAFLVATRVNRWPPEILFAAAGGLTFGLANVHLKVLTIHLGGVTGGTGDLVAAAVADWALWGVVAANAVGFVCFQMALSNGRVSVVNTLNTIGSVVLPVASGFVAFGEQPIAARVSGIAIVLAGTAMLVGGRRNAAPAVGPS
jgi:drug/metabolite transporter (DMT)-like permease